MHWHVEWRYFLSDRPSDSNFVKREDRRVREDAPLGALLRRHLEGSGGGAAAPDFDASTVAAAAAAPLPFRALLRLDGRPANSPGWLEFSLNGSIDEEITLAELLRGRTIDEFPVVAVVGSGSSAPLLPPGEVVAFSRAAPAVVPLPPAAPLPPVAEENKESSQL